MKKLLTILFLLITAWGATAQQRPLKPRPDAFPPVQETLETKANVMATTVEEMANWDRYPTYPVYLEMMQHWVETYPTLCHIDTIGTSLQGRLILSVYIDPNLGEDLERPEFFYSATIHGDELTGYIMMLRLIDTLLSSYGSSPELTELLNTTRISINPLANPDGTYWGGNNSINRSQRYNADGIDLNRTFPDPFYPVIKNIPHENQLMIAYLSAHNFRLSANLHGGAEVMNYPWDSFTSTAYPHIAADWWHAVGLRFVDTARLVDNSRFLDVCDEGVITGGDWYVIDGGRQDYVNYYHNCLEMTMELSSDKIVQSNRLPQYWRILSKPLINYIGEIHTAPNICGIPSIERSKLTVFPNPTKGKVTVTGLDSKVKLELLDMMGRNLPLPIVSRHENEAILDLGELAPGLYLLRTPEGSAKLLKR